MHKQSRTVLNEHVYQVYYNYRELKFYHVWIPIALIFFQRVFQIHYILYVSALFAIMYVIHIVRHTIPFQKPSFQYCDSTWSFEHTNLVITNNFHCVVPDFDFFSLHSQKGIGQSLDFEYSKINNVYWCSDHKFYVIIYNDSGELSHEQNENLFAMYKKHPYFISCTEENKKELDSLLCEVLDLPFIQNMSADSITNIVNKH